VPQSVANQPVRLLGWPPPNLSLALTRVAQAIGYFGPGVISDGSPQGQANRVRHFRDGHPDCQIGDSNGGDMKLSVPLFLMVVAAAYGCGGTETGTVQGHVIFEEGTNSRYRSNSTLQLISVRPGSHGAVLATQKVSSTGTYQFTVWSWPGSTDNLLVLTMPPDGRRCGGWSLRTSQGSCSRASCAVGECCTSPRCTRRHQPAGSLSSAMHGCR
jgi:hypothetical protein